MVAVEDAWTGVLAAVERAANADLAGEGPVPVALAAEGGATAALAGFGSTLDRAGRRNTATPISPPPEGSSVITAPGLASA